MQEKTIRFFDTTLRDGEQAPGCSMSLSEKLEVAKCLERLHVDVIEAGFPASSAGDANAVKQIAEAVQNAGVAALARAAEPDIKAAWEAVKTAKKPRIHLFLATSAIHMQYKLHMTEDEVLERAGAMTAIAASLCPDVEFSAEDATRSDRAFLARVVERVIDVGATVVNIPDTVGYTTPSEMQALIAWLIEKVPNAKKATFSVHCHNDLGMAVANSIAGLQGGAGQVECTIGGIGERAGNAALEELAMAMRTREPYLNMRHGIEIGQIWRSCKTVYNIIGSSIPVNKPLVGKNAFAHEAGIHQHGVMENRETYELFSAADIGISHNPDVMVLGRHSGHHAFEKRLSELGIELSKEEMKECFSRFKKLCEKKKIVTDRDLEALARHQSVSRKGFRLDRFDAHAGNFTTASCTMRLKLDNEMFEDVALGDGPIDAAYNAIDKIIQPPPHTLEAYSINSVSEGRDTLGEVMVKIKADGVSFNGRGLSTDIIEASIYAYLNAINQIVAAGGNHED